MIGFESYNRICMQVYNDFVMLAIHPIFILFFSIQIFALIILILGFLIYELKFGKKKKNLVT